MTSTLANRFPHALRGILAVADTAIALRKRDDTRKLGTDILATIKHDIGMRSEDLKRQVLRMLADEQADKSVSHIGVVNRMAVEADKLAVLALKGYIWSDGFEDIVVMTLDKYDAALAAREAYKDEHRDEMDAEEAEYIGRCESGEGLRFEREAYGIDENDVSMAA